MPNGGLLTLPDSTNVAHRDRLIALAAQHRLPITFVIVRNGCYEGLNEFGRLFQMDDIPGAELPGLDYCALAHGHGIEATRVTRCEELDAALTRAFASATPTLLEVQVEP